MSLQWSPAVSGVKTLYVLRSVIRSGSRRQDLWMAYTDWRRRFPP
jgi:hypothetical protein